MNALDLFRAGHDTVEIAHLLRIKEAEAYVLLHVERERERIARETQERRDRRRDRRLRWIKNPGKNAAGKFLYAGAE